MFHLILFDYFPGFHLSSYTYLNYIVHDPSLAILNLVHRLFFQFKVFISPHISSPNISLLTCIISSSVSFPLIPHPLHTVPSKSFENNKYYSQYFVSWLYFLLFSDSFFSHLCTHLVLQIFSSLNTILMLSFFLCFLLFVIS